MFRLLETIRCEEGVLQNLPFHQARMDASISELFKTNNILDLEKIAVPGHCKTGLYKCRLVYGKIIESVDFLPYQLPVINSLKIVSDDEISYAHKFADRSALHRLMNKKGSCDDILIVKNGLITDTSYANIVFFNGKTWLTTAKPLLKGTQRAKLIEEEKIIEADIRPSDLSNFTKARLINAMMHFEDKVDIEIGKVFY